MFKKFKKALSLSLALATFLCVPTGVSADTDKTQKGDVNADGKFGITDVMTFKKWLLGVSGVTLADTDAADFLEDGMLNSFDLKLMKQALIEERKENAALRIGGYRVTLDLKKGYGSEKTSKVITSSDIAAYPKIAAAYEKVAAKADTLKDAEMLQWGTGITDYGQDELYLPCKDGEDILLCYMGEDCAWLDDPDVQELVTLLTANRKFSDEYILWVYMHRDSKPYIGCEPTDEEKKLYTDGLSGKTFIYEKEGYDGPFTIGFNENGNYSYSISPLSSMAGGGSWKTSGDTLLLTERDSERNKVNCLKIDGDTLIYDAAASDGFWQIKPDDGDKFSIYNDNTVARMAKARTFDINSTKDGVSEFVKLSQANRYAVSEENCYNITPENEEFFSKYDVKLFRDDRSRETYAVYHDKYMTVLGTAFGDRGITSFALADMNLDGMEELYFTFSWGSGMHRSEIGYFDVSRYTAKGIEYTDWDGDMVFVTDNGKLEVYNSDVKLGEIALDLSKNLSEQIIFKEIDKNS